MIVTIPCSCFFICRTGNCYTSWPATPRIINLIAESEVRTGHSKRNESIFRGICIRFCDSLMGPVGTTKSPDPSGLVTVSYTHLDVYKRQVYDSPSRLS